jgi:hypothetical protein
VIFFAAFMTPGLTLTSFILFIFTSGFATRPYFDQIILKKSHSTKTLDFPPIELKTRRKKV